MINKVLTKIYLVFIVFTLLFFSCNSTVEKKTEENINQNDALQIWSDTVVKLKYEDGTIAEVWGFRPHDTALHYEIKYYRNGIKWIEGPMYGKIRHGKWKAYDEEGNLIAMGTYKMGKGEGIKTVWHSNGQKFYEGHIENGERVGIWEFYKEDGVKFKEVDYSQINKAP